MKKHLMKFLALAVTIGVLVQTAVAADFAVGGWVQGTISSSRLNDAVEFEYWVGKCHLEPGDDPIAKYQDAVPLEATYSITDVTYLNLTYNNHGSGYSTNGIVRLKGWAAAVFTGLASNDCIYVVEKISLNPACSSAIDTVELLGPGMISDDLPGGYDGVLHGGRFWYATDVASRKMLDTMGSHFGYVLCGLSILTKGDPLWQCRIDDVGYKTLEEALDAANAGDTIYLKRDLDLTNNVTVAKNVTITTELGGKVAIRRLDNAAFDIAANVVLTNVTVNGLGFSASRPMLNVADGATLTLATDVTVNSCVNTNGNGGAIASSGTVVLNGARIVSSSASGLGGAIYASGGVVDARAGEITGCSAAQGGGAAYLAEGASMALAGTFHAMDNTVGEAANNVQPTGATQLTAAADFAGLVGVSYPAAGTLAGGAQFGVVADAANVAARFRSDVSPDVFTAVVESDGRLVWKETSWNTPVPVVMAPVAPESLAAVGAETKTVGEDVVLIFSDPATVGSFTVPSNTYARILCVGGGAAGGTVGLGVTKGAGGGGGAGGYCELSTVLKPGSYEVSVGAGAARVDSYAQSWVGNNGGVSWIRPAGEAEGHYLLSAKGGGGGGAPKSNGVAVDGGSGGGGSWWGNKAIAAGSAVDGYGWKGAKPTAESVGGGGGGATTAGLATGEGGSGRASDITGETVVYAAGGTGGSRLDAGYVPHDGATPGSGGDGAGLPGKAGAGADGIVVVRLTKAFTPVKVPYPAYSVGVPFTDGETVSPFGDDLATSTNRFFIAEAQGTFEVPCSTKGRIKEGVGRYSFTLTLKDGYAWDDGTLEGSTAAKTFFWRVKEPNVEGHATAEVTKTVSWSEGTNAVISIEAHTSPELVTTPPTVLVLGTLCDAHMLTPETIMTCLNTAAEVANVEYYFYAEVTESEQWVLVMEDAGTEYWEEFWEEFWATRDLWEEEGESWWIEHWNQISKYEESLEESLPPDVYLNWDYEDWTEYWDGYWEEFWWGWDDDGYWPLYEAYCEKFGNDEGWQEYWEKYWVEEIWGPEYAEDWEWGYNQEFQRVLEEIEPLIQGELAKGACFTDLNKLKRLMNHPQHHALYGFYERLARLIDAGKKYDYVILCFDRSHVADEFPSRNHPREADVVAFLKPFYAGGRVIWLLDNESPGLTDEEPMFWATPWRPSQFKCITPNVGPIYWRTYILDEIGYNSDVWYDETIMESYRAKAWNIHKALFGMFDPEAYDSLDQQTFYDNLIWDLAAFTPEQVAATSGKANPNQVVYDDAGMVGDLVRRIVKPISYTVSLADTVNVDEGLELDSVSGLWTANAELNGWQDLVVGENLFPTNNGASVKIAGVDSDIWIKLDLQVHDTGAFRTSIHANYNPQTGLWEKDPNKGPVKVQTSQFEQSEESEVTPIVTAEDEASTEVGWMFAGYELTGTVESNIDGLITGDIVVNGYSTNWVAVGANSSPQTVFRAAPGYLLEKVVVDGEEVPFDIATCEWTFDYVNANHDVKVWYKPYFVQGDPPPVTGPVTNVYDGTGYGPTVTNVCFSEEIPYPWYPVYSMESNGVYTVDGGQTNVVYDKDGNITSTNVYVRIAVLQPGYDEPVILDNWTGINEVTILPREVTVTFDNYTQTDDTRKTGDFPWTLTDGELVDGDEIAVSDSTCTEYPEKGEHTDDSISSDQVVVVDADGNPSGNYIIHVEPGDYYYPDYELVAEAEGVEKVYDGKPSTIEVVPTTPKLPTPSELKTQYNGPDYAYIGNVTSSGVVIKYSDDGGLTYTLDEPPAYTDTGTYTVPYQVTYAYTFDHGPDADHATTQTVTYNTVTGTEDVIIHPREVTITFDNYVQTSNTRKSSGFTWEHTGGELVDGDTISVPGSTCTSYPDKGSHTDDSITANGTVTVRDADGQVNDNYIVHVVPGDYYYPDNQIVADAKGIEKIYDGARSTIEVTPTVPPLPTVAELHGQYGTKNDYKNIGSITSNGPVIKYSADGGNTYTLDAPPEYLNVGTNTVYYQVEYSYSFKHGKQSASTLQTVPFNKVTGQAEVIIHPREVTVTFDNYVQTDETRKEGDFSWTLTDGELVDGDEINVPGSTCTEYPEKGGHTDDTITAEGTVAVVDGDGEPNGNYIVHVVPGDYYWPDEALVAEAEGVTKVYDGEPSTITVTATVPPLPTAAELKKRYGSNDYAYVGNITSSGPIIKYSNDGGVTFTLDEPPEYTDAGTHTVPYQVTYSYTFDHGTDAEHASPRTVTFNTATGSADVVITPRPVYVTADSDVKFYDGTALTDGDYTVAEPTDTTGFVTGEGATFQMTVESSQTLPGKTANTIDPDAVVAQDGTKLSNYEFHYTDGTLTVRDGFASVPTGVEKVYDGESCGIDVKVTKSSDPGNPLKPGEDYTIKYSLYPDDPDSWVDELSYQDVTVSNKVYYVVEPHGGEPITNFAYVTIWPREIVVTADDKSKQPGMDDPVLTWVVTDGTNAVGETVGILPDEFDLVNAAVSNDVLHVIARSGAGTEAGERPTDPGDPGYPITVGGSDYVGNYHVTYVPGELVIPAIFSSNIHGLLKICSPFANTIIPAPWKGYTRDGSPTNDIPVDRLVKPRNLTEGDMILQYSGGGVYKAWTLEKPAGGEGRWTPLGTVAQTPVADGGSAGGDSTQVGGGTAAVVHDDVIRSLYVTPTGDETQKRGYGMWLVRQRPVDESGNVIPFYLYGQWMTGVENVSIGGVDENDVAIKYAGAQYAAVHDTMLADPDCTRVSVINHHTWKDYDNADTIILNTDLKQSLYCFRREKPKRNGGGFYDGWWIWGTDGYTTNNISTPAGVGFWYERRAAGNMSLRWEGPDRYPGEGRDLDVWIVDHADGGDGKTHLAFKFVGAYAQDPVTPAYIKELFESGSIRYLHTTGGSQTDGKAEMDRLSQNLKDNARPVPALRNGTGVNTQEELEKGWIWVTVDVPDGTIPLSDKDGSGDTNGAGDLWRIVVGRGIWE